MLVFARRDVLAAGVAALATIAEPAAHAQDSPGDALARVHPELRGFAEAIAHMDAETPRLSDARLPAFRQMLSQAATPRTDVPWRSVEIPGARGQPDVVAYLINEDASRIRPAIVHTHGGAFVGGSAQAAIVGMQGLAHDLDCVVLTIEYRLAPETNFRGSIEDNYTALKWLSQQGAAVGVNADRIALLGESAGGGHAALLAITARDRGEVSVAFQCLIYPMLDDRTGSSRHPPPHIGRFMHMSEDNRYGWRAFLGQPPGGRLAPRGAVPARVADLRGLPPAFIGVGGLDLFVDEDIEYARRLTDAGVSTEFILVPGAIHVFDAVPANVSRWFNAAKYEALRRALFA